MKKKYLKYLLIFIVFTMALPALREFVIRMFRENPQITGREQALKYMSEAEKTLIQGDTVGALLFYDKAIALDSSRTTWIFDRGVLRENIGDSARAFEDFRQTVKIDSTFAEGYFAIATALYRKKKYQESIEYWDKVISLAPNSWSACFYLGLAYYHTGEYEKAIFNIKKI
jgi:tetratricopeptide (TPR) repeat protein